MSNEQRKEHNTNARQASYDQRISDVMFHNTKAAMVYGGFDIINDQEHVALTIGRATFFLDGKNANERLVEMQLIGLAIVAASEELLKNGPA